MNQIDKRTLVQSLDELTSKKILVIGDLMLDQYIWGSVQRISPEGPIPVLKVENEEFRLGGAANTALDIQNLDCSAIPVGIVGMDHSGDKLIQIFEEEGVSTKGILRSNSFHTIVKQRAITDQQQLLRIDYETELIDNDVLTKKLWNTIEGLIENVQCVVLSDYVKGVLSEELTRKVIERSNKLDIPIVCDPGKGIEIARYKGITSIKPNRLEAEKATGIKLDTREQILKAASILKKDCKAKFVTVSLDKDGILFYGDEERYEFMESKVPEVFDVTGAGDMMISTLAVLLANKVAPHQATYVANVAAGIETSHLGVVPIPWSEIKKQIAGDNLNKKIVKLEKLKENLNSKRPETLIFTNGYFDNISAGHLRFLLEISKFPGQLVVALNSDACIKRQKGSYPILKEQDRARLLASIENVHYIVIFEEDNASSIISSLSPNIVVKGEAFKGQKIPEHKAIESVDAKIEYISHFSWESGQMEI